MGKLIVIEGSDGSGKATQTKKLLNRLLTLGINVRRVTYPTYTSESSALVNMYLRGDFGGNAADVNPYAAATFYAVDRFADYHKWRDFFSDDGIVLSDRYVGSNMAYQAVKLKTEFERMKFFMWLDDLEFERFGLPRPDMTIYLDMPPAIAAVLRRERGREDIHEDDAEYMKDTYEIYTEIARRFDWKIVKCYDGNFARSSMDIHQNIMALVEELLIPKISDKLSV